MLAWTRALAVYLKNLVEKNQTFSNAKCPPPLSSERIGFQARPPPHRQHLCFMCQIAIALKALRFFSFGKEKKE